MDMDAGVVEWVLFWCLMAFIGVMLIVHLKGKS